MAQKKKTSKISIKTRNSQAALTKEDMVGFIGPILEELKEDMRQVKTQLPILEELKGDVLQLKTQLPILEELKGDVLQLKTQLPILEDLKGDVLQLKTQLPILEELKEDMRQVKTQLPAMREMLVLDVRKSLLPDIATLFETQTMHMDKKFKTLKNEIIHEVKILIENDDRLKGISDVAKIAELSTVKIENHESRITHIEKDVITLRAISKA